jgi:trimeric autotransporter adhesin
MTMSSNKYCLSLITPLGAISARSRGLALCLTGLLWIGCGSIAQASDLSISSDVVNPSGTASLGVALTVSGTAPAGLQWTINYSPGSISGISITPGPAGAAAAKTLSCVFGSGTGTCILIGLNTTSIGSGVVAYVNATLAPGATSASIPISNPIGVDAVGNGLAMTSAVSGTITAPSLLPVNCAPSALNGGGASTCTITLSRTAPAGGSAVTLGSNNTLLTVPASVTVAAGATTATFSATAASTIASNQNAIITARFGTGSQTATISLVAPVLISSLTCNPASLGQSAASTCTITLSQTAPTGGSAVTLASNNTSLIVPASVTVAAGASTASFSATAAATIASNQSAVVTATLGTGSKTAAISLTAPVLLSYLSCLPTTLGQSAVSSCTVTLSQTAPTGGSAVTLASNNTSLTVPASVTVAAGASTASFSATAAATIASNQSAVVTATLGTGSKTAAISLTAPVLLSYLGCLPTTLGQSAVSSCTVTLSQTAPTGGSAVTLASNNTSLTVPASVTVAAGASTASFSATAAATIASNQSAVVTATLGASSKTATISLTTSVLVSILACSPTTLGQSAVSSCTITLSQTAPTGGSAVTLASNNTSLTVPASVTVAAGASTASFSATAAATIASNQSAVVTATLGASSKTATISLTTSVLISTLACSPTTLGQSAVGTCTVTLSQTAPTGGSAVTLASNNSSLTVPASVTVAAGASTASFSATAAATIASNQTAIVTATLGASSKTATISLTTSVLISTLACSPTTLGQSAVSSCTVTLSQTAPTGGSAVTLASNNTSLTVPASVTVAAGATIVSFSATAAATIASNQSAVVTATLGASSKTATISLTTSALISTLACSPTTLGQSAVGTCTVTLAQTAPTGGSAVTLASDNTSLTVPASVTVAAGATTAAFSATAAAAIASNQSAIVTATLGASSKTATISLTAPVLVSSLATYPFSESSGNTTADLSGNSINGTLYGATWTTAGKYGNALAFNGKSAYVDLGNPSALQLTGSMTLEAWIFATANPSDDGQIIAKSGNSDGWQLKTSLDTGVRTFGIAVSDGATHVQRYSKSIVARNTWYYVTGVYNAGARTLDIYVNGVLNNGILVGTVPATQHNSTVNANIGRRTGGYLFRGTIDEVRVYGSPLTQAQIQADMTTNTSLAAPQSLTNTTVTTSSLRGAVVGGSFRTATNSVAASISGGTLSSPSSDTVSSLHCSPRVVAAGGIASCELMVRNSSEPVPVELKSSSEQVRIPAVVTTRSNQSSLTFQVQSDTVSRHQPVTITATRGAAMVEDTILVTGASGPSLRVPARQVARAGTLLSFAVGSADPSDMPLQVGADAIPPGASFDPTTGLFSWKPNESQTGKYKIAFAAVNSARQSSTAQVEIEIDSAVPVLYAPASSCSPGGILSLTGKWLAAPGEHSDASGGSFDLAGTRVAINDEAVPVLYSSADRVEFLCPAMAAGSEFSVRVTSGFGTSQPATVRMQEAVPSIVSLDDSRPRQGLITSYGSNDLVMERNFRVPSHPAQPGDQIVIRATGLGAAADQLADALQVKLSDVYVRVDSIQPVPRHAGLYELQVRVPAALTFGAVPVQLQITTPGGHQLNSDNVTAVFEAVRP